jgi:hypothetical protein
MADKSPGDDGQPPVRRLREPISGRADQRSFVSIDFDAIEIQRQVFGNAIDQVD